MGRKDAERLLLNTGNNRGTFLVRESETTKGGGPFFTHPKILIFCMNSVNLLAVGVYKACMDMKR